LAYHSGHAFSTKDRDNDTWSKNCATHFKGGWWFSACQRVNINGLHLSSNKSSSTSASWYDGKKDQSMKTTSMKIR